ncbi:MAG: iron ABC transporter permease [Robiginitomaculum sp.]|nr:iron ABC transporter permease [Robiginitomaculum sp.]
MRLGLLILFGVFAAILSLSIGALPIPLADLTPALFGRGDDIHITIMQDLRAPRTLLALVIGAGLGASGAALQGYTRNPLADPGILGFSATAALGAVLALYFGHRLWITPAALAGAGIGAALLLAMAGRRQSATVLILAGVGIGSLATALTGLLMNFAPNPWALSEIVYWLMGSLKNASYDGAVISGSLTLTGLLLLFWIGPDLRALSLGEDTAKSLGVPLGRLRVFLVLGVALCVGAGVAVAGAIGFIGLFIPHILRAIFGPDPARLIPLSALGGAGFLALADSLTRVLSVNGTVMYLGILSALIGAPFFIWLAFRAGRS